MPFCSILLIFNLPHNEYTHPILDIDVHNNTFLRFRSSTRMSV